MQHSSQNPNEHSSGAALPEIAELLDRRWKLTQDRSQEAAIELREMDESIRKRFERTVAPLVLDISGFTRLAAKRGLLHYLTLIQRMATMCDPIVRENGGTVVKHEADNLFAYFSSVAHATKAASDMQSTLDCENFRAPADFDIDVSIGIGYGPILVFDHDMWGHELILASKLGEDIAASREILLTEAAQATLQDDIYQVSNFLVTLGGDSFMVYRLESSHVA